MGINSVSYGTRRKNGDENQASTRAHLSSYEDLDHSSRRWRKKILSISSHLIQTDLATLSEISNPSAKCGDYGKILCKGSL